MKSRRRGTTAFGGLRVREAMGGFPLAASPAKGKIIILCVLCVSVVNMPLKQSYFKKLNAYLFINHDLSSPKKQYG